MELRDSSLWQEIKAVAFDQAGLPPLFTWTAQFLANKKRVTPFKLISIDSLLDFKGRFGAEIILEVMIPAGDFVYDIYPHRQDLLVDLSKNAKARSADVQTETPQKTTQQLRATIMGDYSMAIEGARSAAHSREALNLMDVMTVKFQLIDLALERIRMHSVGGLFRDSTPADILKYILTSVSTGLDLDEANAIKGVEMVQSPNTQSYKQVIIPHGTRFPDLPVFLHHRVGGIYPAGMGVHLFQKHWYVYPLYDLTRFDKSTKTLTLINLPTNQMPGIERTYRTTAHQVIALVTGEVKHRDQTESKLISEGNGVRFLDARRVIDGFSDTTAGDNKASVMRAANNNEFVTDERIGGLNNVMTSNVRTTSNKFAELSKLAERTGAEMQCTWENADSDLIYPGMPVKYMYIKNDRIQELKGVVLGAEHYVQTHGIGVTDTRHINNTTLFLFLSREKPTS